MTILRIDALNYCVSADNSPSPRHITPNRAGLSSGRPRLIQARGRRGGARTTLPPDERWPLQTSDHANLRHHPRSHCHAFAHFHPADHAYRWRKRRTPNRRSAEVASLSSSPGRAAAAGNRGRCNAPVGPCQPNRVHGRVRTGRVASQARSPAPGRRPDLPGRPARPADDPTLGAPGDQRDPHDRPAVEITALPPAAGSASRAAATDPDSDGKLLVLWRPVPEKEKKVDDDRKAGPREIKVLKNSSRYGQRPEVKVLRVLGNQRLTPGGTVKRAKKPQLKSLKKRSQD